MEWFLWGLAFLNLIWGGVNFYQARRNFDIAKDNIINADRNLLNARRNSDLAQRLVDRGAKRLGVIPDNGPDEAS